MYCHVMCYEMSEEVVSLYLMYCLAGYVKCMAYGTTPRCTLHPAVRYVCMCDCIVIGG